MKTNLEVQNSNFECLIEAGRSYLDHNATTPISRRVADAIPELLKAWGNPSSIHQAGRKPKTILRETRQRLGKMLDADPLELVFTSGGTEANNWILKSVFSYFNSQKKPVHFITTRVEHPSVLKTFEFLASLGARVDYLDVTRVGALSLEQLQGLMREDTRLVSVMFANNETGTVFPIKKIAKLCREKNILIHTDAVQAFGKVPFHLNELGVDYATISAHKFYSLKGCGVAYIRRGSPISNLIHGGGQERHRRGGTENVLAIAALGIMAEHAAEVHPRSQQMQELRDQLEARILREIPNVKVTAGESARLPNTSSLVIDGVDGEIMLMNMDLRGIAVSTGAACSSGNPEPSPVLLAMGLTRKEAQSSLRIGIGWETTKA